MNPRLFSLGVYTAAFVTFFDQTAKWWVLTFALGDKRVVPVTSWFNLVQSWNHGVTFGFFNNNPEWRVWLPYVFTGVAVVIVLFLLNWLMRATSMLIALGLGMIIGGAVGNVIDRLHYGAVMDFLDFHLATYHWYAFNLADSAIVGGVGLLLLDHLVMTRKKG